MLNVARIVHKWSINVGNEIRFLDMNQSSRLKTTYHNAVHWTVSTCFFQFTQHLHTNFFSIIKLEFKNRKISLFLCKYRTGLFTWNTPEYNGKQRVYIKGTFAMIKITANCPCYDGPLFFASTPVYFTNHCNPQCPALFITKNIKQYWIQTKICNVHKKYALL